MLSFLVRAFSRVYLLIERRRRKLRHLDKPSEFEYDTNYPFF